ncbi:glycoside hydrolase family 140 protein [Flavihumibacter fluvii]|uniref:glycoside hydrolase family 140 protein n=1 Tax=Flavihumibacter fluvii TaxID=2838157 RepID=UPI001BDEB7BA|nr:glycoside hydrolase family 140 protein [Flavihumibacter fluvii]ULQ54348.1 glycoside hydrolase family 140 protein [Flavihumibacter fluvii]
MKLLRIILGTLILFFGTQANAQSGWKNGRLRVSADGHFLETTNDRPFFWLGDTGWELFHRLDFEEITKYLDDRYAKGFNVIQAVILPEFDGIKKPNRYGSVPLNQFNIETPNPRYFELVDTVIKMAAARNMFMCLLPTWGDKVTPNWGEGPVIFNEKNAYTYGKWLGNRFKSDENIVWMLGGDRPPQKDTSDWRPIWRAMARGLQEGTEYKAFITYHTWAGEKSTSQQIHKESWLSMNTMQSGHGGGHDVPVWKWIDRDFKLPNPKPTLDAEPNYEDHPVNPWPKWDPKNGFFDDYDVRKQCYRSVFAGGCGVTYGHHGVWQFYSEREVPITHADRSWTSGLDQPGAFGVSYLRKLIECRPYIGRIYDPAMIVDGQGEKGEFITAFRGKENDYAMIYIPVGKTIKLNTKWMKSSDIKIWWWDPRLGMVVRGESVYRNDIMSFTPPAKGVGQDWVLVLDSPEFQYRPPGK